MVSWHATGGRDAPHCETSLPCRAPFSGQLFRRPDRPHDTGDDPLGSAAIRLKYGTESAHKVGFFFGETVEHPEGETDQRWERLSQVEESTPQSGNTITSPVYDG